MTVDEQYRRIRRTLEEKLGVEEASYLMDRPVGGWSELVTNHTLDLKFDALDHRFDALESRMLAEMDRRFAEMDRRFVEQTWRLLGAVIAAMVLMSTIFGGFLAAFGT
jgi:hypothetical protein